MKKALITALIFAAFPFTAFASVHLDEPNLNLISQGLVGYWSMDGSTINWISNRISDLSGGGNIGTLYNLATSTAPTPGKIGQALRFNGGSSYIDMGSKLTATTAITLSAWVKITSTSKQQNFIVSGPMNCAAPYNAFALSFSYDALSGESSSASLYPQFAIGNSGNTRVIANGSTAVQLNTWYFVTGTYNGTTMKLYVNGTLVNSQSQSGIIATPLADALIGDQGGGGACTSGSYFPGSIDDLRVYARALSPQEISMLYALGELQAGKSLPNSTNSSFNIGLNAGLVGYWPMDGNTTNWTTDQETDASGNGNTGALAGMSTTSSPVAGKIGGALKLNGSNQYIQISNSSSLNLTSTITISAWVYAKSFSSLNGIVSKYNSPGGNEYFMRLSNNSPYNTIDCGGSGDFTGTIALSANKWYLVTCTISGTTGKLYVNGVLDSTGAVAIISGTDPVTIGSDYLPSARLWSGYIDDVRIYNRTLSAQEIAQLYAQGAAIIDHSNTSMATGINTGLVGYWTFDGGTINWSSLIIADVSGSAETLSMTGYAGAMRSAPTFGKIGQALNFNGSQYLSHGSVSAFNFETGDFSVSFWMKPASPWNTATTIGLVGQKTSDTFNGWQIYQDSSHPGILDMRITQQNNFMTNSTIPVGKWTYVTFVRKSGSTYWYINASLDNSGTNSASVSDSGSFYVGYAPTWTAYYTGALDDLRIYNRALSAQEIAQLYATGK